MRLFVAALVAVLSITASVVLSASVHPDRGVSSFPVSVSRHTVPQSWDGLDQAIRAETDRRGALVAAVLAWKARQDAWYAAAAEAARRAQQARTANVGPVSGSCAAMKPAGFPDSIIQRESGGDPTARSASGAYGCAQIMPEHFRSGGACAGLDYAACWARLWAGGAGASNWACRPDWGCHG